MICYLMVILMAGVVSVILWDEDGDGIWTTTIPMETVTMNIIYG